MLQWARANGCPWNEITYAEILETEAADAEVAVQAATVVDIERGFWSSMGMVVALEAFDTWHTSSHTWVLFLLILLVRPLAIALVQSIVVCVSLCFLRVVVLENVYINAPGGTLPPLTPRQTGLIIICFILPLALLLGIAVIFKMFLRILIIVLPVLCCTRPWWIWMRRRWSRIWRWIDRTTRMQWRWI